MLHRLSVADVSWLPFDAGLDHVTGHELEPGLQVFAELFFWPVEVSNERLQSIQLPEEVLGRPRAVAAEQTQVSRPLSGGDHRPRCAEG